MTEANQQPVAAEEPETMIEVSAADLSEYMHRSGMQIAYLDTALHNLRAAMVIAVKDEQTEAIKNITGDVLKQVASVKEGVTYVLSRLKDEDARHNG